MLRSTILALAQRSIVPCGGTTPTTTTMMTKMMLRTVLVGGGRGRPAFPLLVHPFSTQAWKDTLAGHHTGIATPNFPEWLHLKAYAPYDTRIETTTAMTNMITTTTGGYFLSSARMPTPTTTTTTALSDIETTLVIQDMDPQQLENWVRVMTTTLPGVILTLSSQSQLQHCIDLINGSTYHHHDRRVKAHHITMLEQVLHDIERDGLLDTESERDVVRQCHDLVHQLSQKNKTVVLEDNVDENDADDDERYATTAAARPPPQTDTTTTVTIPPTVNAIFQLHWQKEEQSKTMTAAAATTPTGTTAWPWTDG
jgi:hypothetical protein